MKKAWRSRLIVAGALTLLMICAAAAALAVAPTARFCWTVEGHEVSITLYDRGNQGYWLFLPAALKGQDPILRIDQDVELLWEGESLPSGAKVPVEQYVGQQISASWSDGRRLGPVTIMRGSEIPALFFTIDEEEYARILKGTKFDIRKDGAMVMLNGDGSVEASAEIPSFKTRGNSTFYASKKPYQFKMAKKEPLGGMERNKTWILLANWFDISLIRNQMLFDLCREIGLNGTPDTRQVELYINGAYLGVYLLSEKIQLKQGRLEIRDMEERLESVNGVSAYDAAEFKKGKGSVLTRLRWFDVKEPEDITGGYLLEIEKELQYSKMKDAAGFVTDAGMCVVVKEPSHAGFQEVDYIGSLINDFHHALLRPDGISEMTGTHYSRYIDMRSFALKIAMEEFTCNFDVRASSQFMYKDSDRVDDRVYAGPAWDYDLSCGNKDDGPRNPRKQDYVLNRSTSEVYIYHWLLTHEDFQIVTRQLLDEVFLPAAEVLTGARKPAEGSPLRSVEAYQDAIRASADMNFVRYSARAIPDVWDGSGRTFEEAGAYVKDWVTVRVEALRNSWLTEKAGKQ